MTPTETHRPWRGLPAEERRSTRRAQLVEAGLAVFGEAGYARTSIDAVCAEAGLTKRYFYESFATTEELLLAVYAEAYGRVRASIDQALAQLEGEEDPVAIGLVGVEAYLRALDADHRLARVMFREIFGVSAAVDATYTQQVRDWEAVMGAILTGLTFREMDFDLGVSTCWAVVAGSVLRWVIDDFARPVEDLITAMRAALGAFVIQH